MPTPDAFDPNAPAIPDEIRETLFTKPAFALGEPTKALGNALRANATLRARIAELEAEVAEHAMCPLEQVQARLALAEKVCEAAEWFSGKIHWSAAHTIGVEFELKTFREALAAWMAQKH